MQMSMDFENICWMERKKKPEIEEYILSDYIYIKFQNKQTHLVWQKAICVGLGLGLEKLGDSQRPGG